MRFFLLIALMSCGCRLTMQEVNRELMPHIERNQIQVESLRQEYQKIFDKVQEDISSLELAVSTLRDRIQSFQKQISRDLAYQNERLAQIDQMELKLLEQKRVGLQNELQAMTEIITQLQSKLTPSDQGEVEGQSDDSPLPPSPTGN